MERYVRERRRARYLCPIGVERMISIFNHVVDHLIQPACVTAAARDSLVSVRVAGRRRGDGGGRAVRRRRRGSRRGVPDEEDTGGAHRLHLPPGKPQLAGDQLLLQIIAPVDSIIHMHAWL
uniref:Uncharacterized protein n=1 Tax=Arundo donax TaxID=35708 RepID=A0A0A9EKP5_ARUDO